MGMLTKWLMNPKQNVGCIFMWNSCLQINRRRFVTKDRKLHEQFTCEMDWSLRQASPRCPRGSIHCEHPVIWTIPSSWLSWTRRTVSCFPFTMPTPTWFTSAARYITSKETIFYLRFVDILIIFFFPTGWFRDSILRNHSRASIRALHQYISDTRSAARYRYDAQTRCGRDLVWNYPLLPTQQFRPVPSRLDDCTEEIGALPGRFIPRHSWRRARAVGWRMVRRQRWQPDPCLHEIW